MISARQFAEFAAYFEWCDCRRDKADYYGAQVAGMLSGRKRYRLSEFMAPSALDGGGQKILSAKDAVVILKAQYGKP